MPSARLVLTCAALLASGCNLSEPVRSFQYQGEFIVIWFDAGIDDHTPGPDVGHDAGREGAPLLVITELMVRSSDMRPGLGERGEFIEIRNVGDGPANPRSVALVLVDPTDPEALPQRIQIAPPLTIEEVEVVGGLRPIEPGDYFVFVRHEVLNSPVGEPGRVYDYGRFANGPTLVNEAPRVLELRYVAEEEIVTHDTIRFGGGEIRRLDGEGPGLAWDVDTSVSVRPDSETPESNDDPSNWCLNTIPFGEGNFRGNPGRPAECDG